LKFFKDTSNAFIIWLIPLFKPQLFTIDQFILKEGDDITNIFFMNKGTAHFVLPIFNNQKYISVDDGDHFGLIDIIGSQFEIENDNNLDNWYNNRHELRRHFTIQTSTDTADTLSLHIEDVYKM